MNVSNNRSIFLDDIEVINEEKKNRNSKIYFYEYVIFCRSFSETFSYGQKEF